MNCKFLCVFVVSLLACNVCQARKVSFRPIRGFSPSKLRAPSLCTAGCTGATDFLAEAFTSAVPNLVSSLSGGARDALREAIGGGPIKNAIKDFGLADIQSSVQMSVASLPGASGLIDALSDVFADGVPIENRILKGLVGVRGAVADVLCEAGEKVPGKAGLVVGALCAGGQISQQILEQVADYVINNKNKVKKFFDKAYRGTAKVTAAVWNKFRKGAGKFLKKSGSDIAKAADKVKGGFQKAGHKISNFFKNPF